jgi:TonB family protein
MQKNKPVVSILSILIFACLFYISCDRKQVTKPDKEVGNQEQSQKLKPAVEPANNDKKIDDENEVFEVVNVNKMPKEITRINPKYPKSAGVLRYECTVICRVLLDTKGKPIEINLLKACNNGFKDEFVKAVTKAIMNARWTPAYYKGKVVKIWISVIVRFSLN